MSSGDTANARPPQPCKKGWKSWNAPWFCNSSSKPMNPPRIRGAKHVSVKNLHGLVDLTLLQQSLRMPGGPAGTLRWGTTNSSVLFSKGKLGLGKSTGLTCIKTTQKALRNGKSLVCTPSLSLLPGWAAQSHLLPLHPWGALRNPL